VEGEECECHSPQHLSLSLTLCDQVANDSLSLRQPVNIASLAFLSGGQGNHHHLAIGNELGSVRRYDTRASKQPVADWAGISRVGGIRRIEKGFREQYVSRYVHSRVTIDKGCSELFAADSTTNLSCLDLRNGRALYGYQGRGNEIPLLVLMIRRSVRLRWFTRNSG
jgi:ribosome biogenesis protein NSA1